MPKKCLFIIHVLVICQICPPSFARLKIGVGRADCTGPAAEVTFVRITTYLTYKNKVHIDDFFLN